MVLEGSSLLDMGLKAKLAQKKSNRLGPLVPSCWQVNLDAVPLGNYCYKWYTPNILGHHAGVVKFFTKV